MINRFILNSFEESVTRADSAAAQGMIKVREESPNLSEQEVFLFAYLVMAVASQRTNLVEHLEKVIPGFEVNPESLNEFWRENKEFLGDLVFVAFCMGFGSALQDVQSLALLQEFFGRVDPGQYGSTMN